ncbi:MAG: di-/tricarboxylate transporter [Candidatus Aminicenantes bacterium]|nr:di-/tricarboxylate transporter [Candidatus Aminicenantes bacterium]
MKRRTIGAATGIVAAFVVLLLPRIEGLDSSGQSVVAIIVMAVIFWATDVLNAGITAVLTLGLLLAARVPASVALGGFSSSAFWIVVSVLFFGRAMDKTGLARRIAYRILRTFRPSYAGILFAFMIIGFILALGIPSMTVRTAIMVPIAWALVKALDLPPRSRGSALVVLTTFEMAVLPGCAILTGSLWGPFLTGLFANEKIPITWLGYASVMAVPTLVLCLLLVVVNRLIVKPEKELDVERGFIDGEIKKLGPMSRPEMATALIVALSLAAWATQALHHVPSEAIGMMALTALFATSVLEPPEIATGIPWHLALFIGGALSLAAVMTHYKINAWLAGYIVSALKPAAGLPLAVILLIAVGVMVMRLVEPIGFITLAAFFLALAGAAQDWGIHPLVLAGTIVLPLHVFWFNYHNIWITMTEGITQQAAYADRDRKRLATAFMVVIIITLIISAGYWKLIF